MKIKFGSFMCEVGTAEKCRVRTAVQCDYGRDTIIYAVKRFFSVSKVIKKECINISWKKRIAKGREKKTEEFMYIVPAIFMELPGNWIRVAGVIDSVGVWISRIEILKEYPV